MKLLELLGALARLLGSLLRHPAAVVQLWRIRHQLAAVFRAAYDIDPRLSSEQIVSRTRVQRAAEQARAAFNHPKEIPNDGTE